MSNKTEFTHGEAAEYLGISSQYLYQARHTGKGPKCIKREFSGGAGRGPTTRLVYKKSDLDSWNAARTVKKEKQLKASSAKKANGSSKPTAAKGKASRKTELKAAA